MYLLPLETLFSSCFFISSLYFFFFVFPFVVWGFSFILCYGLSFLVLWICWPPDAKNWLIWKDLDPGKDWRWETEDEMVGWHHRPDGHEFKKTQTGSLVCFLSMGLLGVGHDWVTELNCVFFIFCYSVFQVC